MTGGRDDHKTTRQRVGRVILSLVLRLPGGFCFASAGVVAAGFDPSTIAHRLLSSSALVTRETLIALWAEVLWEEWRGMARGLSQERVLLACNCD